MESQKFVGELGVPLASQGYSWKLKQCEDAPLSLLAHSSTYLLTPVYETGTVLGAEDKVVNRFLLWWGLYCSWEICTINKINVQVSWYIRKCYGEIHSKGDRWEPRGKICNFK